MQSKLFDKISSDKAVVGVIGLGYVGLPLALEFAGKGLRTVGFDIDPSKVELLNEGKSYINHIPSEQVASAVADGFLAATHDYSRLSDVDVIIICVPTPLTKNREPDLSYVLGTAEAIVPHLRKDSLVILESTTYPGTTENELRAVLEKSSLIAGKDFYLAFSPEREDPGNKTHPLRRIPKVVGGFDQASLELAELLYSKIAATTVPVSKPRTAEAVKLMENIFRAVNIALVNELKVIFAKMDIDIWEVIEAAETKPFGYMPFYPGPGLGGHCIPIDPFYLSWCTKAFKSTTRFIELAGEINTAMPEYVINTLIDALNARKKSLNGSSVLVVGIAYKKDVADVRESPGLTLMEMMLDRGGEVDYYDPLVPEIPPTRDHATLIGRRSISWDHAEIGKYDAVLIVTDHSDIDYETLVESAEMVVDCRNATKNVKKGREKIVKA